MEISAKKILFVLSALFLVPLLIFTGCDSGMKGESAESDALEMNMSVLEDDAIDTDVTADGDVVFVSTETRSTGRPVTVTYRCDTCCGPARMIVVNGGACAPFGYRVSSAVIAVNGETIFGPSDFNQQVELLEADLTLIPGENVLEVTLRSRPGSKLTIIILKPPCDGD